MAIGVALLSRDMFWPTGLLKLSIMILHEGSQLSNRSVRGTKGEDDSMGEALEPRAQQQPVLIYMFNLYLSMVYSHHHVVVVVVMCLGGRFRVVSCRNYTLSHIGKGTPFVRLMLDFDKDLQTWSVCQINIRSDVSG